MLRTPYLITQFAHQDLVVRATAFHEWLEVAPNELCRVVVAARRKLGGRVRAEEVAQDLYVKLCKRIERGPIDVNAPEPSQCVRKWYGYLARAAHTLLLDARRAERAGERLRARLRVRESAGLNRDQQPDVLSAFVAAEYRRSCEAVVRKVVEIAADELSPTDCLHLRKLGEFLDSSTGSLRQCAVRMGLPTSEVHALLRRIRSHCSAHEHRR
jgi:DNA-directed RNA polymerase specialized sigma24 family protein